MSFTMARLGYLIFSCACALAIFTLLTGTWWAVVMSKESLGRMLFILVATLALGTGIFLTGRVFRYMLAGK